MSRAFFARALDTVATFWRIYRRDGVALGFVTHDRDLRFDGLLHRAAPGMVPHALRRTAGLADDSAEVRGALTHDGIAAADLAAGRFDGARVEVGAIDWESLERTTLYTGTIGRVGANAGQFGAELHSAKAALERDYIPRTSPTCRAQFCGPGCDLPPALFTHETALEAVDLEANAAVFSAPEWSRMAGGRVRWIDGPHCGMAMRVLAASAEGLVLDRPLDPALAPGTRAELREGCDRRLATCAGRFGNAANFRGEPYVPGLDLLARYPVAR
ncbi:DUF2163 domain-containing protein [Pelagerythrobacter marensis]|uniref:Bacteriophage phiJL001 Gp84 C-terminal domain-containing protein n=1 Tax=Pelagerythrobacter marensis TaxID=543877 RepID=A0A0G3XBX1_9SPHN|nr:DUF2163 domain-containing protein [Pelagerythrobacter marensis]AKM08126.1 hypothetical protein AM2010_2064 [Pelagerythrobacter marensis]